VGVCQTGRYAHIASFNPHHGEERVLSGKGGSGTIFFSQCNLHCAFCQNHDISHSLAGIEAKPEDLADLMMGLQGHGCHNINLVTPSHVIPQILEAVALAAEKGLNLPIVYNTGGYDLPESLRLLDGVVDIYMPDFKFWTAATGALYAGAKDYPDRAKKAIEEMYRQVRNLAIGPDGLAKRGLLVRHLVMPGLPEETAAILKWLGNEISKAAFVNVMDQYRPEHRVGQKGADGKMQYPGINRRPTGQEMDRAFEAARKAGLYRFG
jgi:putative pyruvate formate lyase activating enzyme